MKLDFRSIVAGVRGARPAESLVELHKAGRKLVVAHVPVTFLFALPHLVPASRP